MKQKVAKMLNEDRVNFYKEERERRKHLAKSCKREFSEAKAALSLAISSWDSPNTACNEDMDCWVCNTSC